MVTINGNMNASVGWLPLSEADAVAIEPGFYTLGSENLEVGGPHRIKPQRNESPYNGRWILRGVGGSTAASHTSGATLTRYYPEAPGGGDGIPQGGPLTDALDADGNPVTGLPAPSDATDAVPKSYVDAPPQVIVSASAATGGGSILPIITGGYLVGADTPFRGFLAYTAVVGTGENIIQNLGAELLRIPAPPALLTVAAVVRITDATGANKAVAQTTILGTYDTAQPDTFFGFDLTDLEITGTDLSVAGDLPALSSTAGGVFYVFAAISIFTD